MAKITELPLAGAIDGTELVPVVKGGAMAKASLSDLIEGAVAPAIALVEATGAAQIALATEQAVLAGTAETGAVAAASAAVAATASAWAAGVPQIGRYAPLVGLFGDTAVSVATGVNGISRAYLAGTDFAVNYIDGVRAPIGLNAVTYLKAQVWERDPASGFLNSAPGATGDVLVASGSCTAAIFTANGQMVPTTRYLAKSGFYYLLVIEGYSDAALTTRSPFSYSYRTGVDGAQRYEGFVRINAAAYTNQSNTRYTGIGAVTAIAADVGRDLQNVRTSRLGAQAAEYQQMIRRNQADLKAQVLADPIGDGLRYRRSGDSLGYQFQSGDATGQPVRTSTDIVADSAQRTRTKRASVFYNTQALLFADLAPVAGVIAEVTADADYRNNGKYTKVGNTGTGSWSAVAAVTRLIATNISVNGATAAQILGYIGTDNTATPANAAGTNIVNASNNDEQVTAYSVTRTNVDSIIATFSGQWVFTTGGTFGGPSAKQARLFRELRAIHGARIYDWDAIFRQADDGASDTLTCTGDDTHLSNMGAVRLGHEETRMFRAMNGGAPYIHEEVLPLRDNDAAATSLTTGLILGTCTNATFSGGDNSDKALAVNAATGAITRGAGRNRLGGREMILKAENYLGGHEARKTFLSARDTGDNLPSKDIEFLGDKKQVLKLTPLDSAATTTAAVLSNTTKLSVFVSLRVTSGMAGALDGAQILEAQGATRLRAIPRYASNAIIGGSATNLPVANDPFIVNGYFLSIDTDTGLITYATNETSGSVAIPADSAAIRLTSLLDLFTASTAYFSGGALRRYMLFTGRAFNFTSSVERAKFYNPTTFAPLDIGSTGTVDGTRALIDLFGREYDWHQGINNGSLGNLIPMRFLGMDRMGIREIADGTVLAA